MLAWHAESVAEGVNKLAAGKGKKRSVKKEGVQRERSSCGGEGRRGDAPSHTVLGYNMSKNFYPIV